MGDTLTFFGVIPAKRKRDGTHETCQSTVLLLNLWMIGFEMCPSFRPQLAPRLPKVFHVGYYTIALIHAALATAAGLLGLYIVLTAGTESVPPSTRLTQRKLWMRIELVLWWLALAWGLGTYYESYVAPFGEHR